jgi:WD40 repeat protein
VLAIVAIASVQRIVEERDDATSARAVAVDTADRLLVDQAAQLAATDPIAAIVLLRRLDAGSAHWREAWLAATAAWTRGIPIGFHGERGVASVQLSSDGRRVVTASVSGKVVIYDLGDRSRRVVATLPRAHACQWTGELRLACIYEGDHVAIIDTENATTRELPDKIRFALADRKSRAIAETSDHRVVEITDAVREVATDAVLAAASPDLAEIALWRGDALELRTASRTFAVGSFPAVRKHARVVEIRDHRLVALIDDDIYRWRIEPDRIAVDGHWPHQDDIGGVMIAGDRVLGFGGRFGVPELRTIDAPGRAPVVQPAWAVQATRGVIAIESSGALVLRDDAGWFHLGPYPMLVTRVDLSPDGRTLAAVTDRDDVVVWDLAAIRPRAITVPYSEEPIRLAPPDLWTFDKVHGVVRRDLQTGASHVVLAGNYLPTTWYAVARDGSWAALRESPNAPLKIFDGARKRTGSFRGVAAQGNDGDGVVISGNDGTLQKWKPGDEHPRFIGRLPARPDVLAVRGRYVLGFAREIVRLDLATMMQDTAPAANIRRFTVEPTGRAWLVTESGELLRWDVGAAPTHVALAEPVDDVALNQDDRPFAHATHALIALDGFSPHAIAIDSRWWTSLDDGYLATVSVRGELAIVDPETAARLALTERTLQPGAVSAPLATHGDTLVFLVGRTPEIANLEALDLAVPHDPAALRRWLADVTNAEPAAGGRGAVWK